VFFLKTKTSGVVYRGTWNQTEVALKVMTNRGNIVPRPSVSADYLSIVGAYKNTSFFDRLFCEK